MGSRRRVEKLSKPLAAGFAAAIAVAVAALVLAACVSPSSESSGRESATGSSEGTAGSTTTTDLVQAEAASSYWIRYLDWRDESESFLQRCMAEAGFEYTPHLSDREEREATGSGNWEVEVSGPQRLIPPEDSEDSARNRREFAAVGYGTFFGEVATIEAARDAASSDVEPSAAEGDPNQVYVASLSDEAREEYWHAWNGGSDVAEPTPDSCMGRVRVEIGPAPQREAFSLGRANEAEDRILGLVAADPRVVDAEEGFATCAAAAGYDFTTYDDAVVYVDELVDRELERLNEEGVDVSALWESNDWSLILPAERLRQLRQEEIAVALTAWDCAEGVRSVRDQVTAEIEREVLRTEYPDVAVDLGIEIETDG